MELIARATAPEVEKFCVMGSGLGPHDESVLVATD